MTQRTTTQALFSALSLATVLLGGCDPKAASGAIGTNPEKPVGEPVHQATAAFAEGLPVRPMPDSGGITPTLPPIDPVLDPIDPVAPKTVDVQGPEGTLPWKLTNPIGKAGCKCRLVCGPVNDDGSKDCITMCEGGDC